MEIDFEKSGGLVPAVIQDLDTQKVLMVGYMNKDSFEKTLRENIVTFYSRSKGRLWTKGEESGNFLYVKQILLDCDADTLLIKVSPKGVVCHTGADTCWNEKNELNNLGFLQKLTEVIAERKNSSEDNSYTASLFKKGLNKIAQKVGEEAVELVIEAKDNNDELFINEAADLLFHYLVLLEAKGKSLDSVVEVLKSRHKK